MTDEKARDGDWRAGGIKSAPFVSNHDRVVALEDRDAEIKRLGAELERSRQDLKNVLWAALYGEENGVELVNRLTTYALKQRPQAPRNGTL